MVLPSAAALGTPTRHGRALTSRHINNNTNTSSIKTIGNPVSIPCLNRPRVLPLSSSFARPSPLCIACMSFHQSFTHTSMLMKGFHFVDCRWSWSCCSWPILQLLVCVPLLYCCPYITIDIAVVGLRSGCSYCCGVPVALGGKDVLVTKILIEDVSTLLLIKDC